MLYMQALVSLTLIQCCSCWVVGLALSQPGYFSGYCSRASWQLRGGFLSNSCLKNSFSSLTALHPYPLLLFLRSGEEGSAFLCVYVKLNIVVHGHLGFADVPSVIECLLLFLQGASADYAVAPRRKQRTGGTWHRSAWERRFVVASLKPGSTARNTGSLSGTSEICVKSG